MVSVHDESNSPSKDRVEPSEVPVSGKRERNRKKRAAALRRAAIELFLARGVDQVTIDEVARAGGMAKGNFYRYFSDKTDLSHGILNPLSTRVHLALERCETAVQEARDGKGLMAAYQSLAVVLVSAALEEPDVVRLYLQENRAPAQGARAIFVQLADQLREAAVELTQIAVDHGLLQVANPRITAVAVIGAAEALAHEVLSGRLDAPVLDIAGTLISLVLSGISGPAGKAG